MEVVGDVTFPDKWCEGGLGGARELEVNQSRHKESGGRAYENE